MTAPGKLDPPIIENPMPCSRCERLERSLANALDHAHELEGEINRLLNIENAARHLVHDIWHWEKNKTFVGPPDIYSQTAARRWLCRALGEPVEIRGCEKGELKNETE